jgi:nitroimidazol reductase NimA-like FMN-containing flavoprotein (pyridoxamine 5'-phosphate oxidase superfamily)
VLEPIDLSREDCAELLRAGVIGRVAVSTPTGPHIVPVNYVVVDDAIVVRTTPYSLLGSHGRNALLAFEVDGLDHEARHGWSVTVRGRAAPVSDADELEQVRALWGPRPWAAGSRSLVLRLPWTELSGRQLGVGWRPVAHFPVDRQLATEA